MIPTMTGCQPQTVTKTVTEKVDKTEVVREAAATWLEALPKEGELASRVIAVADVQKRIDAGGTDIQLVDVRKPEDYAIGHVAGAINIPYTTAADEASIKQLDDGKLIIVICYSGMTADSTSTIWGMMGFETAALKGGMTQGGALTQTVGDQP
jgi:rhodanese-related sulfurtransferase